MPANLPPDYHRAEERFRAARTTAEKIAALEEMLRIMPKHKGTDGLQGEVKARIAKLRREPAKKSARASFSHIVPTEGAAQVALAGPPNSGKSSLLARLTHASPEIAAYPFATREPCPGMMPFEDIAFQLVDLPPISSEHVEPWVFDLVRRADLVWLVVGGENALDQLQETRALLEAKKIGTWPAGVSAPSPEEPGKVWKKSILVVGGADRPGVLEDLPALEELLDSGWRPLAVSSVNGHGLEELKRRTFEAAEIVRVYTKQPGKPPNRDAPFTLPRGSTVGGLAERIHKDLLEHFKFARIWGPSAFEGQTVQRDHVLVEGDVVEIHS